LKQATAGSDTVSFTYDADGMMVRRNENGQQTVYLGKLYQHNLNTGIATRHYAFGGKLVALREGNNNVNFLLTDHLGSVTTTLFADGTVRANLRYDPWGKQRWASQTTPTRYRFTAQRFDDRLGLYDYNARYYDANIGRFISADVIVPETSYPQALNRYTYVYNAPLGYIDSSGHVPMLASALIGAAVGGAVSYGAQVTRNYREGLSFSEALITDINIGKIAGGAAAGAIIGGTFGAAGSVVGLGFWGSVGVGAASSTAAGQASALAEASANEIISYLYNSGDSDAARLWTNAQSLGFLDPTRMVIDATGGAVGGAIAYGAATVLTNLARQAGLVPWSTGTDPVITLRYMKEGPGKGYQLYGLSREAITISESMYDTVLVLLATKGIDAAARFLLNQTNQAITDQLTGASNGYRP
jgi:large repetitive protein